MNEPAVFLAAMALCVLSLIVGTANVWLRRDRLTTLPVLGWIALCLINGAALGMNVSSLFGWGW